MISIITVTYNSLETLTEAYESLSNQSFTNWEWVLQDGNSNDGTKEWITSLNDNRISAQSEVDNGIYDALNKAIARTKGKVIGILHADDFYPDSSVLEQIAIAFQGGVDGVYGDLRYVKEKNIQQELRFWRSCDFKPDLLSQGWMPPHPTLFLRKDVYDSVGNFNSKYRIAADYDFCIRLFQTGSFNVIYLPMLIMVMRQGGASSKVINFISKSKEDYFIIKFNGIGLSYKVLFFKIFRKLGQFLR